MNKYKQFPSLRLYDQLGVPYVLISQEWQGPLWTGHCMMLQANDTYGDAGFWHELAHWMVASEKQRRFPDMMLGRQVNSGDVTFATSSSPHAVEHGSLPSRRRGDRNGGWGEQPVLRKTALAQEIWACHALGYYEPLVGLCDWDEPINLEEINHTSGDFSGSKGLVLTAEVARGCYQRFVEPLGSASLEQVLVYTKNLQTQQKELNRDRD